MASKEEDIRVGFNNYLIKLKNVVFSYLRRFTPIIIATDGVSKLTVYKYNADKARPVSFMDSKKYVPLMHQRLKEVIKVEVPDDVLPYSLLQKAGLYFYDISIDDLDELLHLS